MKNKNSMGGSCWEIRFQTQGLMEKFCREAKAGLLKVNKDNKNMNCKQLEVCNVGRNASEKKRGGWQRNENMHPKKI